MPNSKIFGINFINGTPIDAVSRLGGNVLMVVPSGPGLAEIDRKRDYYEALLNADFAIPDSGLMVILTRLFKKHKLQKLSGPKVLGEFFKQKELHQKHKLFLIDPSQNSSQVNRHYLNSQRISLTINYQYVAPIYDDLTIHDEILIQRLESLPKKPNYILINLGGGVQERLGLYLKNHLSFRVSIICTGAAIAFFTGEQVKLPIWIDKIYLGWFYRILHNPRRFFVRYLKAFRLVWVFIKYKKYIISDLPIPNKQNHSLFNDITNI